MALQSKVSINMAPAIVGMPASVVESHYTALTYQAASDLTVGNFCFAGKTNPGSQVDAAGTGLIRGFVMYTRQYVTGSVVAENSMTIAKGSFVQIATNGKFWAIAQNANAKVGDFVLVNQKDGSITTQTGNANKAGFSMTNFVVEKVMGTAAKSMILISNQQPNVVPPMAGA